MQEDEYNALWIAQELGAEFVEVETHPEWGVSPALDGTPGCYRFFPHKSKGEGLFVAVLRKSLADEQTKSIRHKKDKNKTSPYLKDSKSFQHYLSQPAKFDYLEDNNRIIAVPKNHSDKMLLLRENLKTISFGIEIGEVKGKDFIPAHALSMSTEINSESFPKVALSLEQAITYLRKEAIVLDSVSKGYVLVSYENEFLGFLKNLGNRTNNLYPQEWRIRSGYIPENAVSLLKKVVRTQ